MGGAVITSVGSIGSIVGGILLGQSIIPVPFLGAFIGGVIGGFYGRKGVKIINNIVMKQ
jgi:phage tail tape-measure protein